MSLILTDIEQRGGTKKRINDGTGWTDCCFEKQMMNICVYYYWSEMNSGSDNIHAMMSIKRPFVCQIYWFNQFILWDITLVIVYKMWVFLKFKIGTYSLVNVPSSGGARGMLGDAEHPRKLFKEFYRESIISYSNIATRCFLSCRGFCPILD